MKTNEQLGWRRKLVQLARNATESSPLAVIGVGNTMRGDDGAGSWVAQRLTRRLPDWAWAKIRVWDGGSFPEAILQDVVDSHPSTILFIDSTEMNSRPGSIRLVRVEETVSPLFATHNIPLKVLRSFIPSDTSVQLLGIQISSSEFGARMSAEVRKASNEVTQVVLSAFA